MKVYSQQDFSDCVAAPYPVVVKQADGTSLQVLGKGNSQYHMATTLDGYPVVRNAEGIYEYAVKNRENKWVASGKRASDPGDRKQREKRLLTSLSGEIFGSPAEDVAAAFPEKTAALQSEVLTEKVFPSYGTRKVLLLLIKYSDLENTYTVSDLNSLMNETNYNGTGSLSDYFYQASGGKLTIDADVFGWYTAANDYYYYRWNDEGSEVERVFASQQLVAEAIDAAEAAGVDFSQYDNDQDGYADGIFVVHSGPGAEVGSQTQYIWSHRSALYTYYRSYDDVIIDDYLICPETRPWGMVGIGTLSHEFGHMLGLADLNDPDASDGSSNGIGNWGLMGTGNWLNNESSPSGLCAWSKAYLGWIAPVIIHGGSYSLPPAVSSPLVYRVNTTQAGEYFLLENRQHSGLDQYLPGEGLAIWHIDANQASNGDETHKLVDLEEADGQYHLDNEINRGDDGDLYPGSSDAVTFGDTSEPNSLLYSGLPGYLEISSIASESDNITFTLSTFSPDLAYNSHLIDDDTDTSSGDDDGLVEAGETIEMVLALANEGSDSAHNVAVYLSVTDPDIILISSYGEFGNIRAGGIALCGTSLDFSVAAGCSEKIVTFTLEITADEGNWMEEFPVHIYAGSLWKPCNNIIAIDSCGSGNLQTFAGGGPGVWNGRHCNYSTPGLEQVYSYVATESGNHSITVTSASGYVDYAWKTTDCEETGWICIDDVSTAGVYGKMTWTAGKMYYLLLDDENSITGTHEFYINCPAALTPKIEYYSSEIDDDSLQSAGDGDGQAEPGEFIQLGIALSNTGTGDAHNVSAALSSGDSDIQISDALEDLGDIVAGATPEYPSAFIFSVADGSAEKDVTFTLVVTSDEGKWTLQFIVHIYPGFLLNPCEDAMSIDGCGSAFQQVFTGGGSGVWNSRFCSYSTPGTEQVYSFIAPLTGAYSIEVTAASGYVDYAWKPSVCSDTGWNCIEDIAMAGMYGSMSWTEGTTYFILLDDENSVVGTHRFYINCPVPTEPYVEYAGGDVFDDSTAGDGDGLAEPGEQIRMTITLLNNGTADAVNVSAVLNTTDSSLTISDTIESFGDIAVGAYAASAGSYMFSIANTCHEKDAVFTLDIEADKGSWTWPFSVHVYFQQPNLSYDSAVHALDVSGTELVVSARVINKGENASQASHVGYFLSIDTLVEDMDYRLSEHYISALAPGEGIKDSLIADVLSLQPGLPEGSYYVGYRVDCRDTVSESDEGDNVYCWPYPKVKIHYCHDSFEANNTLDSAWIDAFNFPDTGSYSYTLEATIEDSADMDYYRLDIIAEGALTLTLPAPPENYDIWLLDASGGLVDSSILDGTSDEFIFSDEMTPGTYYLLVNGSNGAHSCNSYIMRADWETWCPLPGEPLVTASKGAYCDSVIVRWAAVEEAAHYDVYRGWEFLLSTALTSYTDHSASVVPVTYYVKARNICGISPAGSDTGYCIGLPAMVDVLTASDQLRCYEILLEWWSAEGAAGYEIYRDGTYLAATANRTYIDTDSTGNKRLYEVYSTGFCGRSTNAISDWGSADTSDACYTIMDPEQNTIAIRIYPNPANNEFSVDPGALNTAEIKLYIYNSQGDAVMVTKYFVVEKNPIRVDVRGLPPGNYQVLIISDQQYFSGRFSKMK